MHLDDLLMRAYGAISPITERVSLAKDLNAETVLTRFEYLAHWRYFPLGSRIHPSV